MLKFSIVTPTYMRIDNIKVFYAHLKKHTGNFQIEWIVVYEKDDVETFNYISKIQDMKIVLIENNGIFSNALKIGSENATGDFINFLGDDDYIINNAFQKISDHINNDTTIDWIIGQGLYINEEGKQIRKIITFLKNILLFFYSKNTLIIVNYVMSPSSFCRKEILQKIKFFENYHWYGNDYISWIRLSKITKPLVLNFPISKATYSSNTLSGSFNLKGYLMMLKMVKKESSNIFIMTLQTLVSVIIILYNFFNKILLKFLLKKKN